MTATDLAVICAYLLLLPLVAIALSGRQDTAANYLGAGHDLPWPALCLSLVATETSTLTVISVPGVAFGQGMVFVGLAIGYLVGRCIVAWRFLPLYMNGGITSAYQYLGLRFGPPMQRMVSIAFLLTRLLAEGVRLFAGTLPIASLLVALNIPITPALILGLIVTCTLLYTVFGGLRAVVWSDTIQLCTYLAGSVACVVLLATQAPPGWAGMIMKSGKLAIFETGHGFFTDPFTPAAAILGGTVLTMASHGTDQLMVQRVLAARTLGDARKALVSSALIVALLFGTLSLIGILLWARAGGASLAQLGLRSSDALFPDFIVHGLPPGLSGLLIAGILSATMGSLSSSLNAMASATITDFEGPCRMIATWLGLTTLGFARLLTLIWGGALVAAALLFSSGTGPAVVFGLSIAAYSYGAMLGVFLFGMMVARARLRDARTAFIGTLVLMGAIMIGVRPGGKPVAFSWMVPLGVISTFLLGWLHQRWDSTRAVRRGP